MTWLRRLVMRWRLRRLAATYGLRRLPAQPREVEYPVVWPKP